MEKSFKQFQLDLANKKIKMKNSKFDPIVESFSYTLITENNILFQNFKFIVIDQCEESDIKYFIICLDKAIYLIKEKDLPLLNNFFSNNQNSAFYFLSDSKSSLGIIKINPNDSMTDFLYYQIDRFTEQFSIKTSSNGPKAAFWNNIKSAIAAYLIVESYNKKTNRISNFLNDQENDQISVKINDPKDYVKLGNISSNVQIIYHIESGELLVLKRPKNCEEKNIQREIANYRKLSHPLFSKFICEINDDYYKSIIIEYINGKELISISQLSTNDKMKIIFQVMLSIEYIHKNGFVYRDLKPDQIIIDQYKNAILIDFDRVLNMIDVPNLQYSEITKNFDSEYNAPEINEGIITYSCDIYSLGILIYFILSIESNQDNESKFKNDLENFDHLPIEFSEFKEICKRCTNKDYTKRPSISELIDEFYIRFYSKIHVTTLFGEFTNNFDDYSEINTIKLIKDIHSNKYLEYWVALSDFENQFSQCYLGLLYFQHEKIPPNYDKSIKYITLSAEKNCIRAHHCLGSFYYHGIIFEKNYTKAKYHLKISAKQNYTKSHYALGNLYFDLKKYNKSIHYLTLAAINNDADSQYMLGEFYYTLNGIPKDINKAVNFYLLAAKQNLPEAQFRLGQIFLNKNVSKAIQYFQLAADQGYAEAQYNLGLIYFNKDNDKALKYFMLASQNQNAESNFYLGLIYSGEDIEKAIYYYRLAADKEIPEALNNLGNVYIDDRYGKKDLNKAIYYLTLSANKGYYLAQNTLGNIYFRKKDLNKAILYLTLSANKGYYIAQNTLGDIYFRKKDYIKAIYFYNLVANQSHNNSNAQYNLGIIYKNGCESQKIKKDINKSIYYLNLAAKQNNVYALYSLGHIYLSDLVPKDINKSIYYFEKAANNKYVKAYVCLGEIYLDEKYNKKDVEKALYYYNIAADNNDTEALTFLGITHLNNKYIPTNVQKAKEYLEKAHNLHDPNASYFYGMIYYDYKWKCRDINKAIYYLTIAAKGKNSEAQTRLAVIYLNGVEVKRDINEALMYFTLADENGNENAACDLGYLYHEGKYVEHDISKARSYYYKASNFGCVYAKNNLGVIYAIGDGVSKNIDGAMGYFNEAKDDMLCEYNLANIYLFEDDKNQFIDDAIDLLIKSIKQSFKEAKETLAIALVKKLKLINCKNIMEELKKYNVPIDLDYELFYMIKNMGLENESIFNLQIRFYKNIYYVYIHDKIFRSDKITSNNKYVDSYEMRNVTNDFYEGFGIPDLINK